MLEAQECPQCGAPLPGEGREGPCPECRLRFSLGKPAEAARLSPSNAWLPSRAEKGRAQRIWRWPSRDALAASLILCLLLLLAPSCAVLWQWPGFEETAAQQRL